MRNYRDYKATDFGVAELSWLWGVNRDILTPPGLDEQWLVSLAHTDEDMATPGQRLRRAGQGAARLSDKGTGGPEPGQAPADGPIASTSTMTRLRWLGASATRAWRSPGAR